MIRALITALAAATATWLATAAPTPLPRIASDEPPLRIRIDVAGQVVDAIDGKQVEVALGGKQVAVTATVQPTRRFEGAGIAFDFPQELIWSFESEDGVDMWTLEGDSMVLMVQQLDDGTGAELASTILDSIVGDLDGDTSGPKKATLRLGSRRVKATRSTVTNDDFVQRWTACGLDVEGSPVILLLQDLPDEGDQVSPMMQQVKKLLQTTFERR